MSLQSGQRLGPYEIVTPVGEGGMGEVYRARDTRLDRMVAVKVLPAHLSNNPELKRRFEREARAISGLNHPHICGLYDVGHQGGIDFLVMEYLFEVNLDPRILRNHYVVGADGQRFLIIVSTQQGSATPITIVVNWHEDSRLDAQKVLTSSLTSPATDR